MSPVATWLLILAVLAIGTALGAWWGAAIADEIWGRHAPRDDVVIRIRRGPYDWSNDEASGL
jgi:hypothetical protein